MLAIFFSLASAVAATFRQSFPALRATMPQVAACFRLPKSIVVLTPVDAVATTAIQAIARVIYIFV